MGSCKSASRPAAGKGPVRPSRASSGGHAHDHRPSRSTTASASASTMCVCAVIGTPRRRRAARVQPRRLRERSGARSALKPTTRRGPHHGGPLSRIFCDLWIASASSSFRPSSWRWSSWPEPSSRPSSSSPASSTPSVRERCAPLYGARTSATITMVVALFKRIGRFFSRAPIGAYVRFGAIECGVVARAFYRSVRALANCGQSNGWSSR